MRFDTLYLWFLGNPDIPRWVGTLQLNAVSRGISLMYSSQWLVDGFALSEDLPLIEVEHFSNSKERAPGAVDDARPDRWGERIIRMIDKPARLSLMKFLYFAGDDRFGALGVSTSSQHYSPRKNGPLPKLEDAQSLSQAVAKINLKEPVTEVEKKMLATGGSFGGTKPKALIDVDGVQWVIKFFNGEPIDVPLVEHASMTLAAKAGIHVAETKSIALRGEHALAIKRFDREANQRIHCISAGTALQAITVQGQVAEYSYPNLAQLLRRNGVTQGDRHLRDMRELFRRMVFNVLIDNTDDHEKNHALLITNPTRHGNMCLAPAYDVLPTNSGQGHQEFGVGLDGHDSTIANVLSQCQLFGLSSAEARMEVTNVVNCVNGWKAHFAKCGVSAADIENLAQRIDGEPLFAQRREF
jgi:serine/threonine-protein kinase HipA